MLFPHLGPSTPTFRCTCRARRHRSSSSTSVRERLASANALAISGKRCEPGFPDAEPFYTYTAPPRIFFGLTIHNLDISATPAQKNVGCTIFMNSRVVGDFPNFRLCRLVRFGANSNAPLRKHCCLVDDITATGTIIIIFHTLLSTTLRYTTQLFKRRH
jgi:hypothetical protein